MKVFTYTFGCQMNLADSEEMARPLLARGYAPAASLEEADCVLVNTCTIRDLAEHKAVSLLGRLSEWKTPDRLLIVAGCAAERLGEGLKSRFPHVDLVAGAKSIDRFPELVGEALRDKYGDELAHFGAERGPLEPGAVPSAVIGYVTVMRGCNYSCAYCIVPSVRGRELYRPLEAVLADARGKLEAGALELVLVGQTVNSWRSEGKDFADLLRAVGALPGLKRLRFISPHPFFAGERMVEAMAEVPAVCPHLHLPVQSGSDRLLKAMRRNYTRAGYLEKLARLRSRLPSVAVTTDLIVGFPGEGPSDFGETLSLLEEADFDAAYCFKFSPREGTEAARLDGAVPEAEKEARLAELLGRIEARAVAKASRMAGRTVEVLLEDGRQGRTEGYYRLRLDRPSERPLVKAAVTGSQGALLTGREA